MAQIETGPVEGNLPPEMTSGGATAGDAAPHCQPSSQPASHLNDVLDTFMKDGMAFNTTLADQNVAQEARPPSINSPTSGSLQHMSNEELNRLLNFDGSFNLEMPLPDIFSDGDGNELLNLEFPGLNTVQPTGFGNRNHTSSSRRQDGAPRPSSTAAASGANGAAPSQADAARSVLASLQANASSPGGAVSGELNGGGGGGGGSAPSGPPSHHPSYCTSPMQQHQMMAPPPQQHHYQPQQHQQPYFPGHQLNNNTNSNATGGGGSAGIPVHMPQHGIPVYVDSRTGQIIHVSAPSPPPHGHGHGHHNQQWQQMGAPSAHGPAPAYFPPGVTGGGGVNSQWASQYHPSMSHQQHQHQQHYYSGIEGLSGGMPPPPQQMMPQHQHSMHFMDPNHPAMHSTMMMHAGLPSPLDNPPSPRKMPAKRKRGSKMNAAATTETMSQRTAKAEQGYTFDPSTGKMYRHGPALEATARDNRELPIVKEIFGAFQQHNYFAGAPPPGYGMPAPINTIPMQQQQQHSMPLPMSMPMPMSQAAGSICNMQMQMQGLPPLPTSQIHPHHQQQQQYHPSSHPPMNQGAMQAPSANLNQTAMPQPQPQQPNRAGAAPSPPGNSNSTGDLHIDQGQNNSLSTSSSMPEPHAGPIAPGGRHLTASTGHGFITSLVTKELKSSTPPAAPALGATNSGGEGNADGSIGSPPQMLGVKRDPWSLFFDAFVVPPPSQQAGFDQHHHQQQGDGEFLLLNSATGALNGTMDLSGFLDSSSPGALGGGDGRSSGCGHQQVPQQQQGTKFASGESIFLGKFPTRDQAGRAHDIAALKLYGDSAPTNFPKETYASTLPVLQLHSEADVIAALKKDSALAMQRTSKYKGVRRTGQGQYEARADLAIVSAGIDQTAMAAAAAAAGPPGLYAPSPQDF